MRTTSVFSASCKALAFAAALSLSATAFAAVPQTINYQALITNNVGAPATSTNVDVKVDFYSAAVAGTLLDTQTFTGLNLGNTGGYVNLPVDVTGIDLSGDLYAELTVTDQAAAGPAEVLAPRQKINSVPFALQAASAASAASASSIVGTWASRVMFVNPDSAAAVASPNGSITAPFKDINAAVAAASAIPNGYNNRTVVMLLPGRHTVTSTIVLNDQGLDLVGFGEKSAAIYGGAGVSPLINATAVGGTGSAIRNLLIQVPSGSGNTALSIVDGRVENCIISQAGGAVAPNLISVNTSASGNTSISDSEIVGDVNVSSYGEQLSFNRGYISGTVTVTAAPSSMFSRLLLTNLGAIGGLNVTTSGLFPAIVAMSNIVVAPNVTYGPNTLFVAQSVGFMDASAATYPLPDPLPPSMLVNCVADTSLWVAPAVSSAGNVAGTYSAFTQK